MLKKFFKDSMYYSFNNFLQKGIAIFLVPVYTRIFSPKDYGIIDIIMVITILVQLIIALEISQGMARYYRDSKSKNEQIKFASSAFWFTLIVNSIFFIFTCFFSKYLSNWIFNGEGNQYEFIVAMLSIFSSGILYFTQNLLRWQLEAKKFSIVAIFTTLVTIALKITFIVFLKTGIVGVFYGLAVGQLLGSILAIYYARNTYKLIIDIKKIKIMLNFSYPLVLSGIGVYVSFYVDRIAIKELLSLNAVGLYGIGFRVASITTLLIAGFHGALTPLIYDNYKKEDTPIKIAKIFRLFVALSLLLILILSVFARELLILFTTEEYYEAYIVIPFLVIAKILYSMYIFSPGLGIAKKTGYITFINVFAAFLNIGLNLLMIPVWGIMGAALATLVSAFNKILLYFYLGNKHYKIPYEWKKILIALFTTVPILITGTILPSVDFFTIIIKVALITIGCFITVFLLIDTKDIKKFFG